MFKAIHWPSASLQIVLAVLLLFSVLAKVFGHPASLRHRERLGVSPWLWRATGLAQAISLAGFLAGLLDTRLAWASGLWLALIMLGATIAHWRVRDAARHYGTVFVLLGLALAVVWLNWPGAAN